MLVAAQFSGDKNIQKHFGKKAQRDLEAFENSAKMVGLYDKLVECEIIDKNGDKEERKKHEAPSSPQQASLMIDLAQTQIELE